MDFRNIYVFIIKNIIVFTSLLGCSNDNIKLVKFSYKGREYNVRIKDVKDDFLFTARRHREITNDIFYHKNSIFANYLSQEIAVIEELESGFTNSAYFKKKYDLLLKKKYYLELFSKGQRILLNEMKFNLKNKYKNLNQDQRRYIEREYAYNFKKKNITDFYTIDSEKKLIKIGEKFYHPYVIPDNQILFKVFDTLYDWKTSKEIISTFESGFTKMDFKRFQEEMENLKDLMLAVEIARKKGLDKGLRFNTDDKTIIKEIALENFREKMREEFKKKVLPEITLEMLTEYYEKNKSLAVEEKGDKKVQLSFNQVKEDIYNVVCEEKWNDFLRNWNEEMKRKYNVRYNEDGIRKLMKMEITYLSRIFRKRENWAANKISFSSITNNYGNAFDGDENTLCVFPNSPDTKWIGVNLGKKMLVNSVVLKWGIDYPESFIVQVSMNGKEWKDVYYVDKVFGGINEVLLERVVTKYVRISTYVTNEFSIREFEVY